MSALDKKHHGDFDWIAIVLQAIEVDTIKIIAHYGDQYRCGNAKNAKKVFKLTVKDERYVDTLDQFVLLWGRGGEFQVPKKLIRVHAEPL